MTKICGLVSNEPGPNLAEILERMYNASWQENHIRREMWHDSYAGLGHFNIGAVNTEPQPLFTADGNGAIVYCGKIFDYTHLKKDLIAKGAAFSLKDNDAEFMLHFLDQGGLEHLPRINGIFSLACWDRINRKLTLVNDRYGIRPLYYHHNTQNGIFAFSSDLRGVIASGQVERKINWRAATVFLHFGHHLGGDTFFEEVQVLPPASILTFEKNTVRIKQYWNMAEIPINESITYPQAVKNCSELLAQAIQRRIVPANGKTIVFLSGGLDSGRIAAELKRQGGDFRTYTTRGFSPDNKDGPRARAVADRLKLEHEFVNLPVDHFMSRYFPRVANLLDYETQLHQWILPLVESLPLDCKINFDGIAGDIPFNAVRRASTFTRKETFTTALACPTEELAKKLMESHHDFSVLARPIRNRLCGSAVVDAIVAELCKYQGSPNLLTCWYLMNRTRRAIVPSPLKLISLKAESFLPYYDNDLFNFVMSLPPLMRIENNLRMDMVQLRYPELHEIYKNPPPAVVHPDDIHYGRQRRQFFWRNVRKHFLGHNWIFNNSKTVPRLLRDMGMMIVREDHVSYIFNLSFLIFFEWCGEYFPHGQAIIEESK